MSLTHWTNVERKRKDTDDHVPRCLFPKICKSKTMNI